METTGDFHWWILLMSNFCILDGDMGRDIFYPLVLTSLCTASLVESVCSKLYHSSKFLLHDLTHLMHVAHNFNLNPQFYTQRCLCIEKSRLSSLIFLQWPWGLFWAAMSFCCQMHAMVSSDYWTLLTRRGRAWDQSILWSLRFLFQKYCPLTKWNLQVLSVSLFWTGANCLQHIAYSSCRLALWCLFLDKGLLVLFLCPVIPGLGFSNMMWQLPCEAFAMAAFSQLWFGLSILCTQSTIPFDSEEVPCSQASRVKCGVGCQDQSQPIEKSAK